MTVLKIGIATPEQYKARTLAIAQGRLTPSADDPKIWFTSIESLARVLSERNRALLAVIAVEKPDSLQALADRTGRAKSNLSRTLKTMERYGLVRLERHGGRTIAPRTTADRISVDLAFQTAA
ncbi:MAG: MarR family transcriptional regulator [Sphingomonadaceae bacterium]